ncbi:hypothetical protein FB446DRAFT_451253 [Lentinula raphanica]|nr:hypothetical protein FB446DRAFT_451253 [Lentinula raphanica]
MLSTSLPVIQDILHFQCCVIPIFTSSMSFICGCCSHPHAVLSAFFVLTGGHCPHLFLISLLEGVLFTSFTSSLVGIANMFTQNSSMFTSSLVLFMSRWLHPYSLHSHHSHLRSWTLFTGIVYMLIPKLHRLHPHSELVGVRILARGHRVVYIFAHGHTCGCSHPRSWASCCLYLRSWASCCLFISLLVGIVSLTGHSLRWN